MAEERRSWAKNLKKWHKEMDTGEYCLPVVLIACSTWGAYVVYPVILKNKVGWLVGWCITLFAISFMVRRVTIHGVCEDTLAHLL